MSLVRLNKNEVDKEMIDGVLSDDPSIQSEYASKLRKFLEHEKNPPIGKIIESGVVPRFVEFLKQDDNIELQLDAANVLRVISEDENANVLIDHGAIQIFVHLLASDHAATDSFLLHMEATLALGNAARASVESRDYVLRCGALSPLLAQLHENTDIWMLRTASYVLSDLCFGQPPPPFCQMEPALSALQRVLHINDEQFLTAACWTLFFLSHGPKENIQSFIDAGLVPRLVQLLGYDSLSVIDRALSTIIYLTNGFNQQKKVVIECGVLPLLANLLTQDYAISWNNIKRDACWAISNITAGTEEQIQAVIDANLIPKLVNLAQNAEFDIKEKAVRAVSNAALGGSHDQISCLSDGSKENIQSFIDAGLVPRLVQLLGYGAPCMIDPALGTIMKLTDGDNQQTQCPIHWCDSDTWWSRVCIRPLCDLLDGEAERNIGDVNYHSVLIEDEKGLEKIQNLQHHESNEIQNLAPLMDGQNSKSESKYLV
ncbi:PREDICTED: importin subunit alpha-1-like [Camelina sativa]|uniref:Importin subunit alpha n=1 Tax=Camelina sativa TaxID=90675 RepID=A0ABM1QGV6_CAMSA|nr:PREDICTED: importin subunit alpha-1-like [Camelina sativa]